MRSLALLILLVSAGAGENPVFTVEDLLSTEFVSADGLVVGNAVLYQRQVGGRLWTHFATTGMTFTYAADAEGNILLTHDDLLYNSSVEHSFILFYKKPTRGLRWNPDGVEIRVEDLAVTVADLNGEVLADVYGFYAKDALVARAWVSRDSGIVKIMRMIAGEERVLTRRKKAR